MNFYRRFIKKKFCIAAKLIIILKNSKDVFKKKLILQISEFLISKTANFFCKLIQIFTTVFFLRYFNSKKEIWIETDISEFVILNILMQKHNDWRLIVYYSWKIIFTERNYKTNNEKLLAIVESVCHQQHYFKKNKTHN